MVEMTQNRNSVTMKQMEFLIDEKNIYHGRVFRQAQENAEIRS